MARFFLFGSRARGNNKPNSDFDVFVIGEIGKPLMELVEPYLISNGGNLDLFSFCGDRLSAVNEEDERFILGYDNLRAIAEDMKEVTLLSILIDPELKNGEED